MKALLLKRRIPLLPPGLRLTGMRNEAHTSSQTPLGKHGFLQLGASQKYGYSEAHQNPLWKLIAFPKNTPFVSLSSAKK